MHVHSDSVGWSAETKFKTPPAGGSDELKFLAFGDMGKAPLDGSVEHYIQVLIYSLTVSIINKKKKIFLHHKIISNNKYMLSVSPF